MVDLVYTSCEPDKRRLVSHTRARSLASSRRAKTVGVARPGGAVQRDVLKRVNLRINLGC